MNFGHRRGGVVVLRSIFGSFTLWIEVLIFQGPSDPCRSKHMVSVHVFNIGYILSRYYQGFTVDDFPWVTFHKPWGPSMRSPIMFFFAKTYYSTCMMAKSFNSKKITLITCTCINRGREEDSNTRWGGELDDGHSRSRSHHYWDGNTHPTETCVQSHHQKSQPKLGTCKCWRCLLKSSQRVIP